MFNFGYLPGGDDTFLTTAANIVAELDQVREWLTPRGAINVIAYLGHPDGAQECALATCWLEAQKGEHSRTEPALPGSSWSPPILSSARPRNSRSQAGTC